MKQGRSEDRNVRIDQKVRSMVVGMWKSGSKSEGI